MSDPTDPILPTRVLWYGVDEPLPERVALRAGPLSLVWEEGDLRSIRLDPPGAPESAPPGAPEGDAPGAIELLRRIYVATRDRNWGTVPNVLSHVQLEAQADSFTLTFDVSNRQGEIDFTWQGTITGTAAGELRYALEGEAHSAFLKNRIGFCVLHPSEAAGARARIEHVDGTREEAILPRAIQPAQPLLPFADMAALAHEVAPGLWAEVRFTGDLFEMEDQRNWTDASYKTFCTPLRLPYPAPVEAGARIAQSVTLRLRDERPASVTARTESKTEARTEGGAEARAESGAESAVPAARRTAPQGAPITFAPLPDAVPQPLPALGLGIASHDEPLREVDVARLSALQPAHLRVDLWPRDEAACAAQLRRAAFEASALGIGLEIALFLEDDPAADLDTLVEIVGRLMPPVRAWTIYAAHERFWGGTPFGPLVQAARPLLEALTPGVPIGAGTDFDLIFLTRSLPPLDAVDFLAYAIQPQAHAFDGWSLIETTACQAQTVATVAAWGKPVRVSPVTLKMRRNPYATAAAPPTPPGALPPQVDPRQMALFGAGWTLRSLKHLAESGAAAVTFYETTGWRGVMEQAAGAPAPARFRSLPGGVYPLYHVLADAGEHAGGAVIPSRSSRPEAVEGLILRTQGLETALLANGTPEAQTVALPGLEGALHVRLLDAHTAIEAMQAPERFRTSGLELLAGGVVGLRLPPYAVARIDRALA